MEAVIVIVALIVGPSIWLGWRSVKARASIIAMYRHCLERGIAPPPELEAAFRREVERNPGAVKASHPRSRHEELR